MRDKFFERKYNICKRNGKDCYVQFKLKEHGEITFYSAKHKVPLNIYRIFKLKFMLNNIGINF